MNHVKSRCLLTLILLAGVTSARGQPDRSGPAEAVEEENDSEGYTPPAAASHQTLHVNGYIDVGYAKAQGDGTSYAPGDQRIPADYGVDTFAPAVNTRGEVASTHSGGRFTNGFLPRSVGIAGRGSFLLNTADLDLLYTPENIPVMIFVRAQALPRFLADGDRTQLFLEQAFGRIAPFPLHEIALTVGKFDSVFGIEYLQVESNLRTGITPSLIARYTTGQSIGAKLFYRQQIPALWSAISLNVAGTNSGNRIESLVGPDASLTGVPVMTARLGYELNLPGIQIKLGGSGLYGARNDQNDSSVHQKSLGGDAQISVAGFSLAGEYVRLVDEPGTGPGKTTGAGQQALASGLQVSGYYGTLAYGLATHWSSLNKVTVYGRIERRHAQFEGFTPILVQRITPGLRLDLWNCLAVKGEYLVNREVSGAPTVSNNVLTFSSVFSW